jgi:hypothetical protein
VGDACTKFVAILLVYVSFLACCSALCLFEKHMLAFIALIHALPTRGCVVSPIYDMGRSVHVWGRNALCGKFLHQGGEKDGYLVQGENLSLHVYCSGGACIHALGALCVT